MNPILKNLKVARSKEKQATYIVLKYLSQVKNLGLHLELGYPSLYKFLIKELQYSEGEAAIRLNALKLMVKSPRIEREIKSGSMGLTKAAKLSSIIEKAESTNEKMIEKICEQIQDKSVRETEVFTQSFLNVERAKTKTIHFNERQIELLDKVKVLYGNMSDQEVLEILMQEKLKTPRIKNKSNPKAKNSRYIPKRVRHAAFSKAKGQCQYIGINGKRCDERRFLQYDHIYPHSKMGLNDQENIQILCASHNRFKSNKTS